MTVLLTVTNLASVGNYGEFEFWFALIKVVAIVAFIVRRRTGHPRASSPARTPAVSPNLWQPDGFMPNGA